MKSIKVVCKKSYTFPGEEHTSFTEEKIYDVKLPLSDHEKGYAIINDLGQTHWIHKPGMPVFDEYFKVLAIE